MKSGYLINNFIFEPTIASWYAWTQLLPPHTARFNFIKKYLPIIKLYLEQPELHIEVSSSYKLYAGPYANIPISDKESVQLYFDELKYKLYEFE